MADHKSGTREEWLDRAPLGRNETGIWFRRHDQYQNIRHGSSDGNARTRCPVLAHLRFDNERNGDVAEIRKAKNGKLDSLRIFYDIPTFDKNTPT